MKRKYTALSAREILKTAFSRWMKRKKLFVFLIFSGKETYSAEIKTDADFYWPVNKPF